MKIAIDISQVAYTGTGVARYMHFLIQALLTYDKENEYVFFFSSLRGKIPHETQKLLTRSVIKKFLLPPIMLDILWNRMHIMPIDFFTGPVDLVITSDWCESPVRCAKKMTIIHDLVVYKYPETSTSKTSITLQNMQISPNIVDTQKRKLQWVKKESDLIITDSQSTQRDVEDILKISREKIKTIYPAVLTTTADKNDTSVLKKYNLSKPYLLTVGKLEPRKNIPLLIEAFKSARVDAVDLVIVGMSGWPPTNTPEVAARIPREDKNIKFLGFVPESDLVALYQHGLAYITTSLYEGFGYPVVEGMHHGLPVLVSNTSSLKEIAEEYGLLFNPTNVDEITTAINRIVNDKKLQKELSQKSKKRAEYFNLKRFADEFINVLNGLK